MASITDPASRPAYVIRVNIHNAEWDGSICTNPTRHDDCHARDEFKSGYCAAGIRRCFFLSLFHHTEPFVKLPKSQVPFGAVFNRQRPTRGDLAVFWGTYADGKNFPVGCWEVERFDDTDGRDYFLFGQSSSIVRFSPRTADYGTMNTRVTKSLGGEMIRLLPPDHIHTIMQRWVDDHAAQLEQRGAFGQDTDGARSAVEGLRRLVGVLPQATTEHLTYRPFEDIDIGVTAGSNARTERPVVAAAEEALVLATEPTSQTIADAQGADALATFPASLVDDYRVALEVSPLVVLAGPSGAGKTRLTSAFADAEDAEYLLVPVRPDWRSNEDLLGFLPPFGETFVPTEFTEFVSRAAGEWEAATEGGRQARRFHVCLDEMNLARPEYYMAELLSRMELEGEQRRIHLYDATEERGFPQSIPFPRNLSIIGTVNNDDTTHALSPKVIDRSVYLNIDVIDLERWFDDRPGTLAQWIQPQVVELDARIKPTGMRIGYRAAGQIVRWVAHAKLNGVDDYVALDAALANLVVARLRVRRAETQHRDMLEQLETFFDQEDENSIDLFPRSLAAVRRLRDRLERYEFAYGQFET